MDELHRSAKLLVDLYGVDAAVEAATRADTMIQRGDMEGAAVWKRVLRATEEIKAIDGQSRH